MKIELAECLDFRCFEWLLWQLPKSGLHLIDGEDLDTKRANMTGKTTLIDVIFWTIYGWLPKWDSPKGGAADNVIRRGKKRCFGKVSLWNGPKHIQIERHRPKRLMVWVDGKLIDKKSEDLEKDIPTLVGMTADQFLLSVYLKQNRTLSFFTKSDLERTRDLTVMAGVEELDYGLVEAKAIRDRVQSEIDRNDGAKKSYEEILANFPQEREKAAAKVQQSKDLRLEYESQAREILADTERTYQTRASHLGIHTEGVALHYKPKVGELEAQIGNMQNQVSILDGELAQQPKINPAHAMKIAELTTQIREMESHNLLQQRKQRENEQKKAEAQRELQLAEVSLQGKCGHCQQDLPQWNREQASRHHSDRAQELLRGLHDIAPEKETAPIRAEIEDISRQQAEEKARLAARPNQISSEINALKAQIATLNLQLQQTKREWQTAVDTEKSEIAGLERQLETVKKEIANRLASFDREISILEDGVSAIDSEMLRLQSSIGQIQAAATKLEDEKNLALDAIDLFGPKGVRALFFDSKIVQISSNANRYISSMTDGIYSTRLDQVGEDSKGGQKLILRPAVVNRGIEVAGDDLSGAALRSYMLVYDLGVATAVSDDSPLFLDESLGGMDAQGKAEALELLSEIAKDRPVFVIDHTNEVKSSFTNVIKIVRKNEVSRLEGCEAPQEIAASV